MSTPQDTSMYVENDQSIENMFLVFLIAIYIEKREFYWILQAKLSVNFTKNSSKIAKNYKNRLLDNVSNSTYQN